MLPERLRADLTGARAPGVVLDRARRHTPGGTRRCTSNPLGAAAVADLTDEQTTDARRVLDGMLRERSGGRPETVLHTTVNVGVGTA